MPQYPWTTRVSDASGYHENFVLRLIEKELMEEADAIRSLNGQATTRCVVVNTPYVLSDIVTDPSVHRRTIS